MSKKTIRVQILKGDFESLEKALKVLERLDQQTKGSLMQVDIAMAKTSLENVIEKLKEYKTE